MCSLITTGDIQEVTDDEQAVSEIDSDIDDDIYSVTKYELCPDEVNCHSDTSDFSPNDSDSCSSMSDLEFQESDSEFEGSYTQKCIGTEVKSFSRALPRKCIQMQQAIISEKQRLITEYHKRVRKRQIFLLNKTTTQCHSRKQIGISNFNDSKCSVIAPRNLVYEDAGHLYNCKSLDSKEMSTFDDISTDSKVTKEKELGVKANNNASLSLLDKGHNLNKPKVMESEIIEQHKNVEIVKCAMNGAENSDIINIDIDKSCISTNTLTNNIVSEENEMRVSLPDEGACAQTSVETITDEKNIENVTYSDSNSDTVVKNKVSCRLSKLDNSNLHYSVKCEPISDEEELAESENIDSFTKDKSISEIANDMICKNIETNRDTVNFSQSNRASKFVIVNGTLTDSSGSHLDPSDFASLSDIHDRLADSPDIATSPIVHLWTNIPWNQCSASDSSRSPNFKSPPDSKALPSNVTLPVVVRTPCFKTQLPPDIARVSEHAELSPQLTQSCHTMKSDSTDVEHHTGKSLSPDHTYVKARSSTLHSLEYDVQSPLIVQSSFNIQSTSDNMQSLECTTQSSSTVQSFSSNIKLIEQPIQSSYTIKHSCCEIQTTSCNAQSHEVPIQSSHTVKSPSGSKQSPEHMVRSPHVVQSHNFYGPLSPVERTVRSSHTVKSHSIEPSRTTLAPVFVTQSPQTVNYSLMTHTLSSTQPPVHSTKSHSPTVHLPLCRLQSPTYSIAPSRYPTHSPSHHSHTPLNCTQSPVRSEIISPPTVQSHKNESNISLSLNEFPSTLCDLSITSPRLNKSDDSIGLSNIFPKSNSGVPSREIAAPPHCDDSLDLYGDLSTSTLIDCSSNRQINPERRQSEWSGPTSTDSGKVCYKICETETVLLDQLKKKKTIIGSPSPIKCEENIGLDLYTELITSDHRTKWQDTNKLHEQLNNLKDQIDKMSSIIETLVESESTARVSETAVRKTNVILKKNISSLYKTAAHEIMTKDNEINHLRSIIRKTKIQPENHRHNPPVRKICSPRGPLREKPPKQACPRKHTPPKCKDFKVSQKRSSSSPHNARVKRSRIL